MGRISRPITEVKQRRAWLVLAVSFSFLKEVLKEVGHQYNPASTTITEDAHLMTKEEELTYESDRYHSKENDRLLKAFLVASHRSVDGF